MSRKIFFIAPHCDDETLFGAYTIMKFKPQVIILKSKDWSEERAVESWTAIKILGAPEPLFLEPEDLKKYKDDAYLVFAPALEGGHPFHDYAHNLVKQVFTDSVIVFYSTYRNRRDLLPTGSCRVKHSDKMEGKKRLALQCYPSQIKATPCHFRVKSLEEYYV